MAKKKKKVTKQKHDYVVITKKGYGNLLKGTKVYFEGNKPKKIAKDGTFQFGKNLLEILLKKFPKPQKFRLILTPTTDSITLERKIQRVRISSAFLAKINSEYIGRSRDIKNDILRSVLADKFPEHFTGTTTVVYAPGTLANNLDKGIIPRLSSDDRDALIKFLPDFIASESHSSVNLLKATAEIQSLRDLAKDLEANINSPHPETWWQTYIQKNILIIQQGYIKAIDKINISIGTTKFPDFSLVTHDNYLDILEIKKPNTDLLKFDNSRGNYYWDTEVSKAIIQTENYLANVAKHADTVRTYLKDHYEIELHVVRPRGIILVGNAQSLTNPKEKDDFRLLSQSLKNITIVTYDELLIRLQNYINVLESFKKPKKN